MNSIQTFRVGTRGSRLSLVQTGDALKRLGGLFPSHTYSIVPFTTVGDRDLTTDLRVSPGDFFTRELDTALRERRIDFAVHSAKDLPEAMPPDIDWFWLPWGEDPRDAWVLPPGRTMADLPPNPVVGISSVRREACCRKRFPKAVIKPLRGAIPDRLAKLDAGAFDAVIMAGAALNRLGLSGRATEWIPLADLPVPPGQGRLAVTFLKGDPAMTRFRSYFVKAVRFVGAGVGSAGTFTLGGLAELRQADVCLYDVLLDPAILESLPPAAERVFVGKRCGGHTRTQPEITELITRYARQGKRVVRLKGGDPGLFGRLLEETSALDDLAIPYRVRAGVSALTVATTETGLLLTRRAVSAGFTVYSPRSAAPADGLPLVLFMSTRVLAEEAKRLIAEGGRPPATPVAVVFDAGTPYETIERLDLATAAARGCTPPPGAEGPEAPGLVVIGAAAVPAFKSGSGPLGGRRILLTCSAALQPEADLAVTDFGGTPVPFPLIRLDLRPEALAAIPRLGAYDWLVLTSPSAARLFVRAALAAGTDLRRLPKLMLCGPGSAAALAPFGLRPDLAPAAEYSAEGLAAEFAPLDLAGKRVLRLRSAKAGPLLAEALRAKRAAVDDIVLYDNTPITRPALPRFDAALFASASAVESFLAQYTAAPLAGRTVVALGKPTSAALAKAGRAPDLVPPEATVRSAVEALARKMVTAAGAQI